MALQFGTKRAYCHDVTEHLRVDGAPLSAAELGHFETLDLVYRSLCVLLYNYVGGMVPFFKTKAQRLAAGDPRKSLEERYKTHDGYVAAVTAAANNAFARGYLLAADRDALIQQAADSNVCNQPGDGGKCNPSAP